MHSSITVTQIEENISRYHTIWLICLIAGICFLIVAIVLFFLLNIPNVFMIVTGLSKKRAIKELDENAAYTTQLSRRLTSDLKKKSGARTRRRKKNEMLTQSGRLAAPVGSVPITQIDRNADYADPSSETTTLFNDSSENSLETTLLSHNTAEMETSVLSAENLTGKAYNPLEFRFKLVQDILLIHTEEDII